MLAVAMLSWICLWTFLSLFFCVRVVGNNPTLDLEGIDLHPHTRIAMTTLETTAIPDHADAIHIYTDGSYKQINPTEENPNPPQSAWSFAILTQHNHPTDDPKLTTFQYHGYYSDTCKTDKKTPQWVGAITSQSHTAEADALNWAILYINSLKNHPIMQSQPTIHVLSDSLSNINITTNLNIPKTEVYNHTISNSLYLYTTNAFPTFIAHVKGHTGDPWNELVNTTAQIALENNIHPPCLHQDFPILNRLPRSTHTT